jgi:hypothetical protein
MLHAKLYFNIVDAPKIAGGDVITDQNPHSDHPLAAKFVVALDRSLGAA